MSSFDRRGEVSDALRHARVTDRPGDAFLRRTWSIPLAARHGLRPLAEARAVRPALLAALARRPGELSATNAVFFDVETTGLGGDDTLVFLVGAATMTPSEWVVEQWLLVAEESEPEFLAAVAPRLLAAEALVTFVGKSFDRHRLDDRFARVGVGRPLFELPHADLYHAARRLLGRELKDVRLATIERECLGIHRDRDLRGAECPEAWLDFVETRRMSFIEPVLRHNALDLLALGALLPALCAKLASPHGRDEVEAAAAFFVAAGREDLKRS